VSTMSVSAVVFPPCCAVLTCLRSDKTTLKMELRCMIRKTDETLKCCARLKPAEGSAISSTSSLSMESALMACKRVICEEEAAADRGETEGLVGGFSHILRGPEAPILEGLDEVMVRHSEAPSSLRDGADQFGDRGREVFGDSLSVLKDVVDQRSAQFCHLPSFKIVEVKGHQLGEARYCHHLRKKTIVRFFYRIAKLEPMIHIHSGGARR
jgi:hypothetical protein